MWVDYLNPEGPYGDMPDIRSFAPTEVATYGDETEDVDILETPEATVTPRSYRYGDVMATHIREVKYPSYTR